MLIVVSYDVSTTSMEGRRRLRNVAKICENYGQRVQNSVFECELDHAQWIYLKNILLKEMNLKEDSLRVYLLGNQWHGRKEHYGIKTSYNISEDLLLL